MKRRIRKITVQEKTGWSASTLNQRIADGLFPKPTYEGTIPYWLEADVDDFIDDFFAPAEQVPSGTEQSSHARG